MPLLKVQNLSCIRNQKTLFHNLNFEVDEGEILHVRGPNGSGKSSLLKILCSLCLPQKGEIIWRNKKDLLYVGHQLGVKANLTVIENFEFIKNLGEGSQIDSAQVLKQFHLTEWKNTQCHKLSAGQKQRVALARLLLLKAQIWLLDEPFTSLDIETALTVQQILVQHIKNQGSVIFTAHQSLVFPGLAITSLELGYDTHTLS